MKKTIATAICLLFVGCSSTKRTPWKMHEEQYYLHYQHEQNRKTKVEQGWDYEKGGWTSDK